MAEFAPKMPPRSERPFFCRIGLHEMSGRTRHIRGGVEVGATCWDCGAVRLSAGEKRRRKAAGNPGRSPLTEVESESPPPVGGEEVELAECPKHGVTQTGAMTDRCAGPPGAGGCGRKTTPATFRRVGEGR